jgi:hypothetical protein
VGGAATTAGESRARSPSRRRAPSARAPAGSSSGACGVTTTTRAAAGAAEGCALAGSSWSWNQVYESAWAILNGQNKIGSSIILVVLWIFFNLSDKNPLILTAMII